MVVKPETLYVFVTFFGPDRAQRSIAFLSLLNLLTTELKHRIYLLSHNLWTKNKGYCTVRELTI